MNKTILAIAAVFVVWSVLDFILHGVILASAYGATASLWRPMEEMKMVLMYIVVLIVAGCFVYMYSALISDKGIRTALFYGLLFGIASGVSMGYGTYSVMPIPYTLAFGWFLGTVVESVAGAWVAWYIVGRGAGKTG